MVTAWLDPKANSSDLTKQVDDDSLVTMVMGFGSISFLLLDEDSLPVWDWQETARHPPQPGFEERNPDGSGLDIDEGASPPFLFCFRSFVLFCF